MTYEHFCIYDVVTGKVMSSDFDYDLERPPVLIPMTCKEQEEYIVSKCSGKDMSVHEFMNEITGWYERWTDEQK